jgi:hypothetical protein
VAKEFTRGRETRLNIICLCYSRTERERERERQGKRKTKKRCTLKSKVREVGVYMFRRLGVSEKKLTRKRVTGKKRQKKKTEVKTKVFVST